MDSLLANYASSDEEGEEHQQPQTNYNKPSSSIFTSLPPPKSSSSLFKTLPPPKSNLTNPTQTLRNPQSPKPITQFQDQQLEDDEDSEVNNNNNNQSSSVFSSLPPPKSDSKTPTNLFSSSVPKPKKIVQFKPPINTSFMNSRDVDSEDDDDKEERERKRSKEFTQTSSVKSFLSAIPAPKNSVALGALSSSGSGRRSIIEADVPAAAASNYNDVRTENEVNEVSVNSNAENYEGQWVDGSYSTSMEAPAGSSEYAVGGGGGGPSYWAPNSENSVYHDSYGYENYGHYGQYESKWVDKSEATSAPEISEMTESVIKIPGKRGRNEIPQDMVEVKQDELIKNRPREDQVKLTGIAFGPSYQPISTKGKPTKLHKRKHQIGSLYFDMRQKETELAERRAKGFLTKAETQAKYGW